jgi:chromosome segregation protein
MAGFVLDSGAHFYRADFQVHTPRDNQWKGASPTTDMDRKDYAVRFIAACRAKSLDAVAITDHHDFTLFPFIRQAAENEIDGSGSPIPARERVVVFPGLELTLGVPCQAILILDANMEVDRLASVLEALNIEPVDSAAPKLPAVIRLDHLGTLEDLYAALDMKPWLRGRYIVLPNVTDGGMGTLMRSGMQVKYKNMPCVGGYLDGTVAAKAKPGSGNRRKFDGLDPAWGNKRIALFQTSDSRSDDFADLGKCSTWVKWAEPSAEAIRQACLAEESRIEHAQPALPSVFISSVQVTNSKFLGPVDLYLNPQYNAIIGGRGTGKSTLLDYIRWCLADTPVAGSVDDDLPSSARQRKLIEATLVPFDAHVEVQVIINGIPHVVRRYAATGELTLKVGNDEFTKASESSIQSLLPVHAYSQKQLSSVSVRLDELSRFVTAPIRRDLDMKDMQISDVSDRLRENYASLQRVRGLVKAVDGDVLAERSLLDQAAYVRASLSGLSPDDQVVLDQRPAVDQAREAIISWDRDIALAVQEAESLLARLNRLEAQLGAVPAGAPAMLLAPLTELRNSMMNRLTAFATSVEDALRVVREAETASTGATIMAAINAKIGDLDQLYDEVKERSTAHTEQLAELASIEGRRKQLTAKIADQQVQLAELGDPVGRHQAFRAELIKLSTERSRLLSDQCARVTTLSEGLLEAKIVRGQSFQEVEQRFRTIAARSGIRSARFEQVFSALGQESDPLGTWEIVLTELEGLMLVEAGVDLTSEVAPNLTRLGLPVVDQEKLRPRITVDSWLDLTLTPVRDTPIFRYQTKEGEFIPFEAASAGQQATALLKVLLLQSGMPLIIDQPEEDLDSQVIQDVVSWIWTAKRKRQLVFASHNANLVVNGDAELIVICDYRRAGDQSGGRLKLQGAIDVPEVRAEITHVMEGGEKAFRLRKEKYGF